jgi:hypothetical protein
VEDFFNSLLSLFAHDLARRLVFARRLRQFVAQSVAVKDVRRFKGKKIIQQLFCLFSAVPTTFQFNDDFALSLYAFLRFDQTPFSLDKVIGQHRRGDQIG